MITTIGIDPDLHKSGVAIKTGKQYTVKLMTIGQIVELLQLYSTQKLSVVFWVEAGWLNVKSNFRYKSGDSREVSERKAKDVGQNHGAGKLIVSLIKHYGFKCNLYKPMQSKWTPEECKLYTRFDLKNQEMIDALRIVYQR